jgi:GNAT superfamily N-acetyltransferase
MNFQNKEQTKAININPRLRLTKKNPNEWADALTWYQDEEMVYLVDGKQMKYDLTYLNQMYSYLDRHGELYFIEVKEDDKWIMIGDVTLCKDDLPIVIGTKNYRGLGIGKDVLLALLKRAKEIGFVKIKGVEIYNHNIGSQKLFTSVGFEAYENTSKGKKYQIFL